MKGLASLTATITAGHMLHGTIKAELNPSTSETTSKSFKWIGMFGPSRLQACSVRLKLEQSDSPPAAAFHLDLLHTSLRHLRWLALAGRALPVVISSGLWLQGMAPCLARHIGAQGLDSRSAYS